MTALKKKKKISKLKHKEKGDNEVLAIRSVFSLEIKMKLTSSHTNALEYSQHTSILQVIM